MFEGQLAYYLNRYLGSYVYGLDPQSLKVSVFSGDVVLKNLQLKPSALADLNLPVTVKSGLLGKLTLKVRLQPELQPCCHGIMVLRHGALATHTVYNRETQQSLQALKYLHLLHVALHSRQARLTVGHTV